MARKTIFRMQVKVRIYAGDKFLHSAAFPAYIEAPDEDTARVMAAETLRNLRVEGSVALRSRHGEARIPLQTVGILYDVERNPEFSFRGVRYDKDAVTDIKVYDEDRTVTISYRRDGEINSDIFGYPCSATEWEASLNSLFSVLGISR